MKEGIFEEMSFKLSPEVEEIAGQRADGREERSEPLR